MALINKARSTAVRFQSWSPSRLDDYNTCPFKAMHKHLLKTCTICFKGKLITPKGMPFGTPQVCTSCGKTPVKGEALERGGKIGDRLDLYLTGEESQPGETITHPTVKKIVAKAKADVKTGKGQVQLNLRFTADWQVVPGDAYDPRAFLYIKIDYLRVAGTKAHVTDWKTGGVEKKGKDAGMVKVVDKYDPQLLTYQVAGLSIYPKVKEATSDLVFLDAGHAHDPVLERDVLKREDLADAKKRIQKMIEPMFNDTDFAPKCSYLCSYCEFGKGKSEGRGPCKF